MSSFSISKCLKMCFNNIKTNPTLYPKFPAAIM